MREAPSTNAVRAVNELQATWVEVSRARVRRRCEEHALVLQSVGIQSGTMRSDDDWILLARPIDAERARAELERYDRENVGWPPHETHTVPVSNGLYAALGYATLLALVFIWQRHDQFGLDWLAAGRADAGRIAHGEWWRAITALSLHADAQHLLGNLVFGSVFGIVLAHSIGTGPAWIACLASGAIGNLLNAWIQPAVHPDVGHSSIGASTAVFGVLGVQAAYEWTRRKELHFSRLRRLAPVIGGLALLGWLGTGGSFRENATVRENLQQIDRTLAEVDVMAHVTGFLAGLALGALLARRKRSWRVPEKRQIAWTLVPVAVLALAWTLAFVLR